MKSSHQVVELLKALGIDTSIKDKDKSRELGYEVLKDSVEERHLKKYADHPVVALYLKLKRYEKACTTYGEAFLQHLNPSTGRLHSSYRQILKTGRIGSKDPNLQNLPSERRVPGFRECFTPSKGKSLIVADYSSQESRILADLANEDAMIDFFKNGDGDLHSFTARRMFKVPVQKKIEDNEGNIVQEGKNENLRSLAKVLNFGIALNK